MVSSFGTDFNYDFNVTMDDAVKPVNTIRNRAETEIAKGDRSKCTRRPRPQCLPPYRR